MPMSAKCHDLPDNVAHYRLVSALAAQDASCPRIPPYESAGEYNLASIAAAMDVPVVLATFPDANGVRIFATHGLDLMHNFARFGAACNDLCIDRAVVIPDTEAHPSLGQVAKHWPAGDVRFLVGIPLHDKAGRRVGSLAVMNTSLAVARKGISFGLLNALAKAYARTGRLDPAAIEK
jgi:GAF domain-containing protein